MLAPKGRSPACARHVGCLTGQCVWDGHRSILVLMVLMPDKMLLLFASSCSSCSMHEPLTVRCQTWLVPAWLGPQLLPVSPRWPGSRAACWPHAQSWTGGPAHVCIHQGATIMTTIRGTVITVISGGSLTTKLLQDLAPLTFTRPMCV